MENIIAIIILSQMWLYIGATPKSEQIFSRINRHRLQKIYEYRFTDASSTLIIKIADRQTTVSGL